jgi:hypothetical protein
MASTQIIQFDSGEAFASPHSSVMAPIIRSAPLGGEGEQAFWLGQARFLQAHVIFDQLLLLF